MRCQKLRSALLSSPLALEIGLDHVRGVRFDFAGLLDDLAAGTPSDASLSELIAYIDRSPDGGWNDVGRPWAVVTPIVRSGCIAWRRAGRTELYAWREDKGAENDRSSGGVLEGPLPCFLRDLIDCCAGRHALLGSVAHRAPSWPKPAKGDGLRLSHKSLHMAIIACKNDGLI